MDTEDLLSLLAIAGIMAFGCIALLALAGL